MYSEELLSRTLQMVRMRGDLETGEIHSYDPKTGQERYSNCEPPSGFTMEQFQMDQVVIAQWLAWQLASGGGGGREVPGSNPGKGDNLLNSD